MYAKQIKNIQLKIIKLNVDQYSEIRKLIFVNNLISIENLLAISIHYFEIFSRSRHAFVWFSNFKKSTLLAEI